MRQTARRQLDGRFTILDLKRVLGVTALVGILGGAAGALAGALVIAGGLTFIDVPPEAPTYGQLFLISTVVGFVVGGFVAPVATWLFLRRVPLWRASTENAFAAGVGFVLSLGLGTSFPIAAAIALGCAALATLRLRFAFRKKEPVTLAPP